MFDGRAGGDLPPDVLDFLQAGDPPIAFTFGTEMRHAAGLFRAAAEACQRLGRRGILLTKYAGQLPDSLPHSLLRCEYAPFRSLFPLCAAVVHHGGIGTTAKALAAGTPQLILPLAFDQPDNAARVRRLGAGAVLKGRHHSGRGVARAFQPLLDPDAKRRCGARALRCNDGDSLGAAADQVEELAGLGGA